MSFFHFLRGDEKPGGGVFGFLEEKTRPLIKADKAILGVAKGAVQSIARTPETLVRSGAQLSYDTLNKATGNKVPARDFSAPAPTSPNMRELYGEGPVETYQKRTAGNRQVIEGSRFRNNADLLTALGLFGTIAGDVTGVGGASKKVGEEVGKKLIKASTAQEVKKIIPGIADDAARAIAITKDRHAIENILNKTKPTPKPNVPEVSAITGEVIPPIKPPQDIGQEIITTLRGTSASKDIAPVKGIKAMRREQEALYSAARGKKIGASKAAGEKLPGSEGYFAERAALKGELPKVEYDGVVHRVGPEKAEDLFARGREHIKTLPDESFQRMGLEPSFGRFNTQTAYRKWLFGEGGVPTNSDIKLLENAFGKDLAKEVHQSLPIAQRAKELVAQLYGVPRTMMTSILDLSFGLRQGAVLGALHPKAWTRANVESVKYFKNEKYHDSEMLRMGKSPEYEIMSKDMGVALPGITREHEEVLAALDIAGKIPTVRRTARAYDGSATRMRYDVAKKHIDAYGGVDAVKQNLTPRELRDLGEMINTASGRGGKQGGILAKNAGLLSTTLFSPRLWASRLNTLNPYYYARLSGPARKEAIKAAGAFAMVAGTALTALANLGGEVETDPRSSDFLKVKFGDTRYDVLGGFQQNIVFLWREKTGETKSSVTGKVSKLSGEDKPYKGSDRLSIAGDLATNKLNPLLGTAGRFVKGEDRGGQPINPMEEVARLFVPLNFQSGYDAAKNTGSVAKGAAMSIPGFFGTGVQSYGIKDMPVTDTQKEYIKRLEGQGATKEQTTATKSFYQNLKVGATDRQGVYDKYKEAIIAGDTQTAIQIANDYNEKLAQALDKWDAQYSQYATEDLKAEFRSKKINPTKSSIRSILKEQSKSTRELQLVP